MFAATVDPLFDLLRDCTEASPFPPAVPWRRVSSGVVCHAYFQATPNRRPLANTKGMPRPRSISATGKNFSTANGHVQDGSIQRFIHGDLDSIIKLANRADYVASQSLRVSSTSSAIRVRLRRQAPGIPLFRLSYSALRRPDSGGLDDRFHHLVEISVGWRSPVGRNSAVDLTVKLVADGALDQCTAKPLRVGFSTARTV